mmetsp:Transcript_37993/g.74727  ORF Transcript_37993/g.74727 Transcript_37993/m.74727 type:complete len:117 (+) Transcript_37993:292-642(+)
MLKLHVSKFGMTLCAVKSRSERQNERSCRSDSITAMNNSLGYFSLAVIDDALLAAAGGGGLLLLAVVVVAVVDVTAVTVGLAGGGGCCRCCWSHSHKRILRCFKIPKVVSSMSRKI